MFCGVKRSVRAIILVCGVAVAVTGCGGGGSGGGSGGGGGTNTKKVLQFSPGIVTASVEAGTVPQSSTLHTTAVVVTPSDFANAASVFTYIVDTTGVITPNVVIQQQSTTTFSVAMTVAPGLAVGSHKGNLTVKVCKDSQCANHFPGSPMELPYDVTVTPTPTPKAQLSLQSIVLGGDNGMSNVPHQVSVSLSNDSATGTYAFGDMPAWLTVSAPSGTLSHAAKLLYLTPDMTKAPYGTTTAALTLTATVKGEVQSLPLNVTVNRERGELLFADAGVAFTKTPTLSRLTRMVPVSDTSGRAADWSVSSDQTWLSVTREGNQVALNANPANLPADTISYATVTLKSSDPEVLTPEPMRVALWKGSASVMTATKLATTYQRIKTDPIRPYLYANNAGTDVDVYNMHTGAKVGTIANLGTTLGNMAISPNGDRLYAYDIANKAVVVADLGTLSKLSTWQINAIVDQNSNIVAMRPNGTEMVFTTNGPYLGRSGALVQGGIPRVTSVVATTRDSAQMYNFESMPTLWKLTYTEILGGRLGNLGNQYREVAPAGSIVDAALGADGKQFYYALNDGFACQSVMAQDWATAPDLPERPLHVNNIEVGIDGRVYCGAAGKFAAYDVYMHSAANGLLQSYKMAGAEGALRQATLVTSSDGMVIAGLTTDPYLVIVPVGM